MPTCDGAQPCQTCEACERGKYPALQFCTLTQESKQSVSTVRVKLTSFEALSGRGSWNSGASLCRGNPTKASAILSLRCRHALLTYWRATVGEVRNQRCS